MTPPRVLVIGGGGREHAIIRALARSPQRPQLFASPGNAGIARDATIVPEGDLGGMDFVIVGPEAPLVAGLADECAAAASAAGSSAGASSGRASRRMPALPGAHSTSGACGERSSVRTIACSRPPAPTTRTLTRLR